MGLGYAGLPYSKNGGMIRSTIFWAHLGCGVAAGLVVLMMSVTGVILTYERQMLAWADGSSYPPPTPDAKRLPLEQLTDSGELGVGKTERTMKRPFFDYPRQGLESSRLRGRVQHP